jgi:DDE superfamily endonuclease
LIAETVAMKVVLPNIPANRRSMLCLAYKRHIINESHENKNIKKTASKYGVQAGQIRRWKRSFDMALSKAVDIASLPINANKSITKVYRRLRSSQRHRFTTGGRPTLFTSEFLAKMKKVLDERRQSNLPVTMHHIRLESVKIHPSLFDHIAENAFNHRMYRMMKKWEISYRWKTTKTPQNTRHTQDTITNFVKYVQFKMKLLDVGKVDIFNADQTNLPFSMESTYTWAKRNSRSVAVKSATSNQRATLMLGCNADGSIMLPPFMVFKGSPSPTGRIYQELRHKVGYPDGVLLTVQERAWFDESIMLQWIDLVWRPMMESRDMRKTYLLLDKFGVHQCASVVEAFSRLNTEIEMIPAGYMAVLQAMDVGVNKPFKDYVQESFNGWCSRQDSDTTKPHRRDAAYWCLGTWNRVKQSTIVNT